MISDDKYDDKYDDKFRCGSRILCVYCR